MNDFVRCNKVSGVHWLNGPVENIIIKVKLKPPDDILSLPKFEEYTNESDRINIEPNIEEYTFKWQEKSFSHWEVNHYSDSHTCATDTEIKYHNFITNNEIAATKVFTYTHEDYYMPMPLPKKKKENSNLELIMEYLNLEDNFERAFGGKTDSMSHLLKSHSSICEDEKWTAMHVVFDHSDPNDDNVIKQESTLFSIYHNTSQNYVILTPDCNDLETNPYNIDGSIPVDFKYGVSVDFGETGGSDELETLLTKLYSKWQKRHKALVDFIMPPLGKIYYSVIIELLYAEGFEMDNLYVEYNIKLPEGIQCNDALHGRTHTSEGTADLWNFGHLIELALETDFTDYPPIKLYLEAISTDSRHNHRTEGYSYHPVLLEPGLQILGLTCLQPEEKSWRGPERRYFVGGCNLIRDLETLSKGDGQNSNYVNTTTGKIHIRYSILQQSISSGVCAIGPLPGSSALLLGAEAALDKYRKARERLVEATRDIQIGSGDGHD